MTKRRSYRVAFTAEERETIDRAVKIYRAENPKSRAVNGWTFCGSTGKVRRYTCTFCRREIVTESANWPPTRHATEATRDHVLGCALGLVTRHDDRVRHAKIEHEAWIAKVCEAAVITSVRENRSATIHAPESDWASIEAQLSIAHGSEASIAFPADGPDPRWTDVWGLDDERGAWRISIRPEK